MSNFSEICVIVFQSNTGFRANNDDGIDIDDLEGSGKGGKEVSNDLESSGSGSGPDDEDAPIPKTPDFGKSRWSK